VVISYERQTGFEKSTQVFQGNTAILLSGLFSLCHVPDSQNSRFFQFFPHTLANGGFVPSGGESAFVYPVPWAETYTFKIEGNFFLKIRS
jgi:hypothetical protein